MKDSFGLEEYLDPPAIAAIEAAEDGLETYQLASFSFHNPKLGIGNNQANRQLLREKLREKNLRFTEGNIAQLLNDEPAFLDSLARTPELRTNVVRVEADLRKELIQKLTEAGASNEFLHRDQTSNLRWVDTRPVKELEDLLARIEARAGYQLMDKKTLRQTARQENAARHPESQYQSLPDVIVRSNLKMLGFDLPKDPDLFPDGAPFAKYAIEMLIKGGGYDRLKRVFGLDQVNARLRGE